MQYNGEYVLVFSLSSKKQPLLLSLLVMISHFYSKRTKNPNSSRAASGLKYT